MWVLDCVWMVGCVYWLLYGGGWDLLWWFDVGGDEFDLVDLDVV